CPPGAPPAARPRSGPSRWSPTAASTCATRSCCSASTSRRRSREMVSSPRVATRGLPARPQSERSMTAAEEGYLSRERLADLQARRLRALLAEVLPANRFYAARFAAAGLSPEAARTPANLAALPFTTKAELLADQAENPPYGTNLT